MPLLTSQPSRLLGGRGGLAVPVPTYGPELLGNGDWETWTTATNAGSWSETVAGGSTYNREATAMHGGTYAARLDIDASDNVAYGIQSTASATGSYYLCSVWAKASAGTPKITLGFAAANDMVPVTTTYTQVFLVVRRGANANALFGYINGGGGAGKSLYMDDASMKLITLASMFSTRDFGALATPTVKANVAMGHMGTRAGVVGWLDSATVPANGIMASIDGTYARMSKLVGGTWSDVVAATPITYVAGALLEIRRGAANAFGLWYNGAQVGTNQTISDAGVISNTLHGYANTDPANTVSGLVVS